MNNRLQEISKGISKIWNYIYIISYIISTESHLKSKESNATWFY